MRVTPKEKVLELPGVCIPKQSNLALAHFISLDQIRLDQIRLDQIRVSEDGHLHANFVPVAQVVEESDNSTKAINVTHTDDICFSYTQERC